MYYLQQRRKRLYIYTWNKLRDNCYIDNNNNKYSKKAKTKQPFITTDVNCQCDQMTRITSRRWNFRTHCYYKINAAELEYISRDFRYIWDYSSVTCLFINFNGGVVGIVIDCHGTVCCVRPARGAHVRRYRYPVRWVSKCVCRPPNMNGMQTVGKALSREEKILILSHTKVPHDSGTEWLPKNLDWTAWSGVSAVVVFTRTAKRVEQ